MTARSIEVTFEEVRASLGVETQRQWSDKAIARTTPLLMGLYSFVNLVVFTMHQIKPLVSINVASWYDKKGELTFSDILALVRRDILVERNLSKSGKRAELDKYDKKIINDLIYQLAIAA